MKKNSKKRGFTIVELVIVIAVIAILAAVLIPTFTSLIKKANLSADQQTVRNMNIALQAEGVNEKIYSGNIKEILYEAGFNPPFSTHTADHKFYWIEGDSNEDGNVVVLVKMKPKTGNQRPRKSYTPRNTRRNIRQAVSLKTKKIT